MTDLSNLAPGHDRASRPAAAADVGIPLPPRLTRWDVAQSLTMGIACLVTYWVMTSLLAPLVDKDSGLLGGMWAVVAVIFVFRDTGGEALRAGCQRLVATSVSFALCFAYQLVFPFTEVGLAGLLVIGALAMAAWGRRSEIITTGITTAVVMVVAAIAPQTAWQQPVLRLIDTVIGIALGVAFRCVGSYLFHRPIPSQEHANG